MIGTDAPLISRGPAVESDWSGQPDRIMVVQTNRIYEPNQAFNPGFVMVPVEPRSSVSGSSGEGKNGGDPGDHGEKGGRGNVRKGASDQGGHSSSSKSGSKDDPADDRGSSGGRHDDRKGSDERNGDRHRQPARPAPSLWKTMLLAGAVALVCGVVGAWGYSALFGPDKSKNGESSSKDSGGGGGGSDSGSSKDSGGGAKSSESGSKDSSSGKEPGARKNSTSNDKNSGAGKLLEAQAAWLAAVKELQQARVSEKKARDAEEEKKSVLSFLTRTLLSAGRPGGGTLSGAFWAGGVGKDVSLRKALDATESQVADTFLDRPLAEAEVRAILGLGYLNLGEPELAVRQYERALALREATQGANNPETASCRNQLSFAYRIAGKTVEAARLVERDPNSPTHAAALATRAAMRLKEHRPADAELMLRECLTIRRKIQPDDWTTFDTEAMLGEALMEQKKYDEAEPYLLGGYEGLKQREGAIPVQDRPRLIKAAECLVRFFEARHDDQQAEKWRKELKLAESMIPTAVGSTPH